MDPKTITPTLTEESKGHALFTTNEVVVPYPKSHSTDDSGYENFSKNNYLSSIFFPVDTKDLSLIASPSLNSYVVLDEPKKPNYSLLPSYSNISASTSSNTSVNPFFYIDVNNVKEEIGFKLEKDIVVECDIIDGMMIRSFTTMDGLEQFVARNAPKQAKKLSPHLKKVKNFAPSSPGYSERDMSRMDASIFVLSEELYYEDYDVPFPSNKRRLVVEPVECKKLFCALGCICDSLNSSKPFPEHCSHTECMFNRVCSYKQKLKFRDSPSPTERYDSKHALFKESSSIKKEIYLSREDIIDQLTAELREKQFEIDNLKNQMRGESVFGSNITLRPWAVKSDTIVKNVKAKEGKKAETKEKFKVEIKEEAEGRRLKENIEVKDAKMTTRRSLAVDGLRMGSFPFNESILNGLAENTTYTIFVRQLMRKMFTSKFLSSKSLSRMKKEHLDAITDAAMKRFKFYRQKNGESARVTPELVRKVITSEFNAKQSQKKKMKY